MRAAVAELLTDARLRDRVEPLLHPAEDMVTRLPFEVADYVDFYASGDHATNVGRIMRPDSEPLLPNWRHLPVGYHGRAGTVVCSGTEVRRTVRTAQGAPRGQPRASVPRDASTSRPSSGSWSASPASRAPRCRPTAFAEHVFGVVGLNDWSARDIQGWEYVPLGPFLGKKLRHLRRGLGDAPGGAGAGYAATCRSRSPS